MTLAEILLGMIWAAGMTPALVFILEWYFNEL